MKPFFRILLILVACQIGSPSRAEVREGKRFTVEVVGTGPDVVLIPGLASPREVWSAQKAALAGSHRLHLVQVRGFGGDDAGPNATGPVLEPLVTELADYIDDEIVGREHRAAPAVVGHSMGGLVGMMIAARQPQLVDRLMVVDALPFFGTLMMPGATVEMVKERAATIRDAMLASPQPTTPVTTDPSGVMSIVPAGRIRVANWALKADRRVVAQAMYDDMLTDLRPEVGKITAKPFTVVYAAGAGPQAEAIWTREYTGSSAKLVAVPGSYHFVMLDQPAAFDAALTTFLAER